MHVVQHPHAGVDGYFQPFDFQASCGYDLPITEFAERFNNT